jgi:hypothetical protein
MEDVFPQWAARELRRLHPHQYVQAVNVTTDGSTVLNLRQNKTGTVASLKMPLVCGPCNKLLGNDIENPTSAILKPVLGGAPTVFTPDQCATVATWGTLKALCYEVVEQSPAAVVSTADLYEFRMTRRPAPQFQMWIGKFDGHDLDLAWHGRSSTISWFDYPGFPAGTPHAQVLTRILGDLIVQSVFVGVRGRVFASRYERPQGDPFTIRIWPPPAQPVRWPPPSIITPETLRYFADIPEPLVSQSLPPIPGMKPQEPPESKRPHPLILGTQP